MLLQGVYVQVINCGEYGDTVFNSLLSPRKSEVESSYFKQQYDSLLASSHQCLNDVGGRIVDIAKTTYDNINNSKAMDIIRKTMYDVGAQQEGYILALNTLEELQSAGPYMQRWIMAEPGMKRLWIDDACAGYEGVYSSTDTVQDCDYDYRRVMDNIAVVTDEGYSYTNYVEELHKDDHTLDFDEQCIILDTWDAVRCFREAGLDPSSLYNDSL